MDFTLFKDRSEMMNKKVGFWLLWLGFIGYAFLLAPPIQPNTLELIANLSLVHWGKINAVVVALFNLMGIWPLIYICLMLIDGRGQKIPAWLFSVVSFGVGAFAILPYLALREPYTEFNGEKNILLKILDSRWFGILLSIGVFALISYGLINGDWQDFVRQWQSDRFIHVMSLDCCLLSLLFPVLLKDDMARRGMDDFRIFWAISMVPLLDPLAYLCVRYVLPHRLAPTPLSGSTDITSIKVK
jgi:hypothetical protein